MTLQLSPFIAIGYPPRHPSADKRRARRADGAIASTSYSPVTIISAPERPKRRRRASVEVARARFEGERPGAADGNF
jgi:hypothetical protein